MDKNEHSIFAYVMDQLDENGIYQGGALIDDPTPSLPRPLGSDDAYIYTAEMPPDLPGAEAVCSMLLWLMLMNLLLLQKRFLKKH